MTTRLGRSTIHYAAIVGGVGVVKYLERFYVTVASPCFPRDNHPPDSPSQILLVNETQSHALTRTVVLSEDHNKLSPLHDAARLVNVHMFSSSARASRTG